MKLQEALSHIENTPNYVFRIEGQTGEYFYLKENEIWSRYAQPDGFFVKIFLFNYQWLKASYEVVDRIQADKQLEHFQRNLIQRLYKLMK